MDYLIQENIYIYTYSEYNAFNKNNKKFFDSRGFY